MTNNWAVRGALATTVTVICVAAGPDAARARVLPQPLDVGMAIQNSTSVCTLGFFGRDAAGEELLVTAGHCSTSVGEQFYNSLAMPIGVVQARMDDDLPDHIYGYTLISPAASAIIDDRFFTGAGPVDVGDAVRTLGENTQGADGTITSVSIDAASPQHSEIDSSAFNQPGDSGGPWYVNGPTLVGMTIGRNADNNTGVFNFSLAVPIDQLVASIRDNAGGWGENFQVLIK
jgi:hypothetical protein